MTRYAIVVEIDGEDREHSRYARLDEARYVFYTFGFERSFKNARIVEVQDDR